MQYQAPPLLGGRLDIVIFLWFVFCSKILHTWRKDFLTLPTSERLINDNNPIVELLSYIYISDYAQYLKKHPNYTGMALCFPLNPFFTLRCLLGQRPAAGCCCLSTAASPVCVKAYRRTTNEPSPICADVSCLLAPSLQVLSQMVDTCLSLSPDLNKQHNACMVNAQKASEGKSLQPSAEGY